jgi:membrane-bound serine protease (ClpP class)
VRRVEPTGFERIASFLTTIAPLLLMGGILGAYVEIKTPGFGIPGIASAHLLHALLHGQLPGWPERLGGGHLFRHRHGADSPRVFVHSRHIIPGAIGFFLVLGSLLWAMIDRYLDKAGSPPVPCSLNR